MVIAKHTGEPAHGEHFFKSTTDNIQRCTVGAAVMLVKEDILKI